MLAIPLATTMRELPASNKADCVKVSRPVASLNHTAPQPSSSSSATVSWIFRAGCCSKAPVQIPICFNERDGFIVAPLQASRPCRKTNPAPKTVCQKQVRTQKKVLVSGFVLHFLLQSFDEIRDGLSIVSR